MELPRESLLEDKKINKQITSHQVTFVAGAELDLGMGLGLRTS